MSELKHYIGPDPTNHTLTEYYLKSEADKVIDDLKKSKMAWVHRCGVAEENERHHKYKRCLAMAKVCYLRFVRYENYLQKLCARNATIAAYKFRRDMYDKWEKRWLELADEPTWAKFLQLIHKTNAR